MLRHVDVALRWSAVPGRDGVAINIWPRCGKYTTTSLRRRGKCSIKKCCIKRHCINSGQIDPRFCVIRDFSRAKAQRRKENTLETRQRFAPLREKSSPHKTLCAKPYKEIIG